MSRQIKNNDSWLEDLSKNLDKVAVQPMRDSLYNQINNIMNGGLTSKFSTVEEVVEDMKARSGLTAMLSKVSDNNETELSKTASSNSSELKENIVSTINNIIETSKGTLPVPAIIEKIKTIFRNDVNDDNFFNNESLISFITKKNLLEKSQYNMKDNYSNLGKITTDEGDESQPWNTDYFYGIDA